MEVLWILFIVVVAVPTLSIIFRRVSNMITTLTLYHDDESIWERGGNLYFAYFGLEFIVFVVLSVIIWLSFDKNQVTDVMKVALGGFYLLPPLLRVSSLTGRVTPRLLKECDRIDENETQIWVKESEKMAGIVFSFIVTIFITGTLLIIYLTLVEQTVIQSNIEIGIKEFIKTIVF
jgi:hypothetical protein